ncbi:MAG: hypothetical protein ACRD9W_00040 [Terriglobia bacterium]
MNTVTKHIDSWSWVVIAVTLVLFALALFLKGLSHDLLLEAGVFLVSVKLILMAYKNGITTEALKSRLDEIHAALERLKP